MVQRKLSYKLNIQPKNALKTDPQNYDVKAIKMKKSRCMKRSTDLEFGGRSTTKSHQVSHQQGEAPTVVTPTKTLPNMKRSGLEFGGRSSMKCHSHTTVTPNKKASPNYMKSTNSSELHKVGKTSSLNKVRSLTKSPSFKHTRTTGSRKKAVLCENIDAQRATCSSTLKEYKFPSYLKLTPGATEAEGTSVMKVCPYTYCSLNGHRHNSAPPLKSFLASKRRVSAPCKQKHSENKVTEEDEFFVEIHVPRYDPADVSLSVSWEESRKEESPVSLPQKQGSSECDYNASDLETDSDSSVSLDQLFGQVSDMEWEEGHMLGFDDEKVDVSVQKDCGGDEIEPGFEPEKFINGKLLPYIYDEIMECLQFSDADTISDSESSHGSQTDGDYIVEQIVDDETICTAMVEEGSIEGKDGAISKPIEEAQNNESLESSEEHNEANVDELNKEIYVLEDSREEDISDIVMEETKSSEFLVEDLPWEARNSKNNDLEEESLLNNDNSQAEVDQTEAENTEDESPLNSDNSQAEVDNQTEVENTEDESLSIVNECPQPTDENNLSSVKDVTDNVIKTGSRSANSEEHDSNEVKLDSIDVNLVEEVKGSEIEDISATEKEAALPININEPAQVRKGISDRGNDSIDGLLDCHTKLKKSLRCNKIKEDSEEERDFNPRPPNFLPVEPEPEAEKVDLRHQDMDERRDAQDWMLDHALQKTVNQLGHARKRKVSLLVEAFEAVLPVPKYEPHVRRNLSGFVHTRPVQACR